MGRRSVGAAVLTAGVLLSSAAADSGGLRRKRHSRRQAPDGGAAEAPSRNLAEADQPAATTGDKGDELAQRFFLPSSHKDLDDLDMRRLIMELYQDGMSVPAETPKPTPAPTAKGTTSLAPTELDCDDPATCDNRLRQQIYDITVRVGTPLSNLDDPSSPQYQATEWIVEECDLSEIDYCSESQIILNEQRYALAVMYFALGGDNWNAGANPGLVRDAPVGTWLSGRNYCEWGAQVSGAGGESYNQLLCDEFGNVLNLNLQSNNMVGRIPNELGVLVYLTSYISFFNAQSGPIPTSLGLITPLQTFDVESNNMDGDLFQPDYVGEGGLTEVVNFRASLNNFRGRIPNEIGRWTKLQNLWFADNEITGTIPAEVGNLVDMNAFLFYKNKIAGTIPPDIGNLDKLTWIDMEDNQIVGTIPEEFYSNLDLEEVIFKNNSISGSISSSVGDLSRLATFWASFNQLSGTIPTAFGNNRNLEELELQHNRLEGPIPNQFGNMESIEFLSLEHNALSGTIPAELFGSNLSGLRILYLNNNQLTGTIPENYGTSIRLKDLWLNENFLTGTLPGIAEGEFLFLEELLINNNDITGEVDNSLCLIRNDTSPGGNLGVFHADCQPPPNGGPAQIVCPCCTACFV